MKLIRYVIFITAIFGVIGVGALNLRAPIVQRGHNTSLVSHELLTMADTCSPLVALTTAIPTRRENGLILTLLIVGALYVWRRQLTVRLNEYGAIFRPPKVLLLSLRYRI